MGNCMKIFKYEMPILEKFTINLPKAAKIIRVDDMDGRFYLWAIVDENELEIVPRYIEAYKTGMEITTDTSQLKYLGLVKLFIMQELGLYLFERVSHVY